MAENLKVNAKTDILEFKRKHNLLVESTDERLEDLEDLDLPIPAVADSGKALGVNASGKYELVTPPSVSFENIEDADGHKRFIEGNGYTGSLEGYTPVYCKWSLSGTHLMLVLAGTIDENTEMPNGFNLCSFPVPSWVLDKVYPVWGSIRIEAKDIPLISNDWTSQVMNVVLSKDSTYLTIQCSSATFTITKDRAFRMSFDLLIDNA